VEGTLLILLYVIISVAITT
jgi:NADH:ubiquinone oxidoreductase subunit H